MMLRLGYLYIILLLVSCGETNEPDRWSEQETVQILTDLHITQAALTKLRVDSVKDSEIQHMNYLLNLYAINNDELNDIVNYAQSDPKRADRIYEQVVARIDSMLSELKEEKTNKK